MTTGMTAPATPLHRDIFAEAEVLPTASGEGTLTLDIDQIQAYEHNPRLLQNPKWQEIEASILASGGLTQALSVTKRPGDQKYTVHQGGNTRLRILEELYKKTSDVRYRQVRVEVQPYTNEHDLAALHDRENACRGDLIFIERAWSKYRQYELSCQENPAGSLTARAFIADLGHRYGDATTVETFSRMKFAVEVIYQHVPTCLVQGGMSERAVRQLIKIRTALERVWLDHKVGTKKDFEGVFFELLARQDRDLAETFVTADRNPAEFPDKRIAIDWGHLQSDLCHEFTILVDDLDHQQARAWVAPIFHTVSQFAPAAFTERLPAPAIKASSSAKRSLSPSLEKQRSKAFGLARKLAAAGGFDDLIEAMPAADHGYRLKAVPASRSLSPAGKACWWALFVCLPEADQPAVEPDTPLGTPSIAGLSEDLFLVLASLLKVLARLKRVVGDRHDLMPATATNS